MKALSCLTLAILAAVSIAGCRAQPTDNTKASLRAYAIAFDDPQAVAEMILVRTQAEADRQRINHLAKQAMQRRVSISSDAFDLAQVIQFVSDSAGVNIEVNWPLLSELEIKKDTPVTLELNRVTAAQLLQAALNKASADLFDRDIISFMVNDGIVFVSSIRDLRYNTELRVYDIHWYLNQQQTLQYLLYHRHERADEIDALLRQDTHALIKWRNEQRRSAPEAKSLFPNSSTDSGQPASFDKAALFLSGGGDYDEDYLTIDERIDALSNLITDNVGYPDDWLDEVSTLRETNGYLYIKTTPADHDEILALLTRTRIGQVKRFERQARLVDVFLLLQKAEAARLDQQYTKAVSHVDEALKVDPTNSYALALKLILTQTIKP